jgi:DNA-binding IclR family transcriptional regulator
LLCICDDDPVVLDLMHGRSVVTHHASGTRLALHASAHGKIWLAFGPEALIKKVMSTPRQA